MEYCNDYSINQLASYLFEKLSIICKSENSNTIDKILISIKESCCNIDEISEILKFGGYF